MDGDCLLECGGGREGLAGGVMTVITPNFAVKQLVYVCPSNKNTY